MSQIFIASQTFLEIRRLVREGILDNVVGFTGTLIRKKTKSIGYSTAYTFLWKHAINAGRVPNLYFERLPKGNYKIREDFL